MGNFRGPNWVHHAQGPRRPVISKRHRVIFLHIAHRQGQGISSDDQRNAYCWFKGADFTKVPMVTWRPFRLQEVLHGTTIQALYRFALLHVSKPHENKVQYVLLRSGWMILCSSSLDVHHDRLPVRWLCSLLHQAYREHPGAPGGTARFENPKISSS